MSQSTKCSHCQCEHLASGSENSCRKLPVTVSDYNQYQGFKRGKDDKGLLEALIIILIYIIIIMIVII